MKKKNNNIFKKLNKNFNLVLLIILIAILITLFLYQFNYFSKNIIEGNSEDTDLSNICVAGITGNSHSYNYCIKPASELLDEDYPPKNCDWWIDCTQKRIENSKKYFDSFAFYSKPVLSDECNNKYGNRYLVNTGTKCKTKENIEVERHILIDKLSDNNVGGILGNAISSLTDINMFGVINAMVSDSSDVCIKARLKDCHVLNTNSFFDDDVAEKVYTGPSPYVYITEGDYDSKYFKKFED